MDLTKRIVARWLRAQDDEEEEEFTDPSNGVITEWDYENLQDKSTWKGYRYKLLVWTWAAEYYESQDEPDDWGDNRYHGPVLVLEALIEKLKKASSKWDEWFSEDSFQSVPKKTKKTVTQVIVQLERMDHKPLSWEERQYITKQLRLKK